MSPTRDDNGQVRLHAIAQRGDIVFVITQVQPAPADLARINALAERQYQLL